MRADNGRFLPGAHWRSPREHWDADWLRNEYVNRGRSTGDIAEGLGITDAAVIYWLKKHGIGRRNTSQARLIKRWGAFGEANPMFGRTAQPIQDLLTAAARSVNGCTHKGLAVSLFGMSWRGIVTDAKGAEILSAAPSPCMCITLSHGQATRR